MRALGLFFTFGLVLGMAINASAQSIVPESFMWMGQRYHWSRYPALTGWNTWSALDLGVHTSRNVPLNQPHGLRVGWSRCIENANSAIGLYASGSQHSPLSQWEAGLNYRFFVITPGGHFFSLGVGGGVSSNYLNTTLLDTAFTRIHGLQGTPNVMREHVNAGLWYNFSSLHIGLNATDITQPDISFLPGGNAEGFQQSRPLRIEALINYYFLTIAKTEIVPTVRYRLLDKTGAARWLFDTWLIVDGFLLISAGIDRDELRAGAGLVILGTFRVDYQYAQPRGAFRVRPQTHTLGLQVNF